MSYLFYIDKTSKAILNPDAVRLMPELRVLDEEESLTIILAYDYYSPYNQFSEEDRQAKALRHVFKGSAPDKFWNKEKIKAAVESYKALQYNPKIDMIRLYYAKVADLNNVLMGTKEEDVITSSVKSIKELRKYIKELEEEVLGDRIEEGVIIGDQKLSWLERMQQNADNYYAVIKKKR
jgi:hypothetical protein